MSETIDGASRSTPWWGAIHVHTDCSDGGVDVPSAIAAAQAAELDFLVITDHNTLAAREYQGYHDGLLVIVDVEITPSDYRHHLLALELDDYEDLHDLRDPHLYLQHVVDQGGFAWVPHPRGFLNPFFGVYNSPWKIWDERIGGLELGTFIVDWVESIRPWNFLRRFRDPASGVRAPHRRLLSLWDRLNAVRPVAGFLGLDAHYREAFGGRLRTPTFEYLFRTHNVLAWTAEATGDAAVDRRTIHRALKDGEFVNILGHVEERGEVRFLGQSRELRVVSPDREGTETRLLRDGEVVVATTDLDKTFEDLSAGVYRAEVYRHGRLWALTNPRRVPVLVAREEPTPATEPARA